jgi:hypothetical protein
VSLGSQTLQMKGICCKDRVCGLDDLDDQGGADEWDDAGYLQVPNWRVACAGRCGRGISLSGEEFTVSKFDDGALPRL